jgi:hypothetical protein
MPKTKRAKSRTARMTDEAFALALLNNDLTDGDECEEQEADRADRDDYSDGYSPFDPDLGWQDEAA